MKIIKHGSKYSENKIATCSLCGCEFEYDDNDIGIDKSFNSMTFPLLSTYKTYVKCPECDKEICLDTKIVN